MPSKELICEFCKAVQTKQNLASHIKAKHLKDGELGKFLLNEYIESSNINTLKSYAKCINPKNNPIYSKLYDGAVYYFGAKPTFFEEEDSYASYIRSDENMKYHNEFLQEIVKTISVFDYFEVGREIEIRSVKVRDIEKRERDALENNKQLTEEIASNISKISYLQSIVDDFRDATQIPNSISEIKQEFESSKSLASYYKKEYENKQVELKRFQANFEQDKIQYYDEALTRLRKTETEIDELITENRKLKEENSNVVNKREAYVNTRVEKEVKKVKDKFSALKDEMDEKDEQIDTLGREIKRLKRAKKSKSNSDSE